MNTLVTLKSVNALYEEILHDDKMSEGKKAVMYADLMSMMEKHFNVPALKNPEWEQDNKAVIALYRKISYSRRFDS